MDPVRKCLLLTLVALLGPAGGLDERSGSESFCEVTRIQGHEAIVNCDVCYAAQETRTSTTSSLVCNQTDPFCHEKLLQLKLENETNTTLFKNRTLLKRTTTPNEDHHTRNSTYSDHNFDSNNRGKLKANFTSSSREFEIKPNKGLFLKNSLSTLNNTYNSNKKCQNCTIVKSIEKSINITVLKVNLTNCSTVDLFKYPSITSLSLHGQIINISKVCGGKNISSLTIKCTELRNAKFLTFLANLQHLNLTDNNLKSIPIQFLPLSLVQFDVSKNKVDINTSTMLPSSLRFLNISHNEIKMGVNVTVKGNLTILDMSKNLLEIVPKLNCKYIEELYLSQNYISSLRNDDFKAMPYLIVLDLRENNINRLEENCFEVLTKLQKLDLSYNKIVILSPSVFQFLNSLTFLSLSGNQNLAHFQENEDSSFLFGVGQRLQIIEACETNLTKIHSTLTRSVKKLMLSSNKIKIIQCGEMDSFPLLQMMDLSHNLIAEIEEDALGRLDFLTHLFLYGNNITNIPKSLPNQLQVLDLRHNSIVRLLSSDFMGLQKLKVLLLSKNRIIRIEDGALGQLVSLEVLDLSYNPIKSLSRTSFVGPRKLKEMYLISLTNLTLFEEPLSFPAPESAHLEVLNMEASPVLASQLMDDVAALTMFHELFELNLNHCRLSTLRNDLPKYLPRLHKLDLTGNRLNCTNIIWLVRWLQTLNISMQNSRTFRKEIYNSKDICCEEVSVDVNYNQAGVKCSIPEYLSGRQIISLKEEDFPDLKLTSSTLPPKVVVTEPYHQETSVGLELDTLEPIDSSSTTSSIYSTTDTNLKELAPTTIVYEDKYEIPLTTEKIYSKAYHFLETSTSNNFSITYNVTTNTSVRLNYPNHSMSTSRNETELPDTTDALVSFLNETEGIFKDFDNHNMNTSISSGAFLSHQPQSSHPGMVLFLLVVGVMLVTASFMVYAQCVQGWRGRDYHPQQDIEVSSLGGSDLW